MAKSHGRNGDDEVDDWHLEGEATGPREETAEDRARNQALATAAARAGMCLRCGKQIRSAGVVQFRIGGTDGKWQLLAGEWAELGEGLLGLELRRCSSCGHVEFRMA